MAKFKIKRNGDIKMTLSREQYVAVASILQHVSIFDDSDEVDAINALMDDMEEFYGEDLAADCLREEVDQTYDKVKFYTSKDCQTISFE